MKISFLVLALTCLEPAASAAQTVYSLQHGTRVRLQIKHDLGLMSASGVLRAGRLDSVILQRDEQRFAVASAEIHSAFVSRGERKITTLGFSGIGGLIGGLVLGAALATDSYVGVMPGFAIGFGLGFAPGAAIGLIVGVATPRERWRRIPVAALYDAGPR